MKATRIEICKQYPHCLSCPLALSDTECFKMSQQEIDDIMEVTRKLEADGSDRKITKEIMQEMIRDLKE